MDTLESHSYILKNEQAPFCIPCNEPFTAKHFLITCAEFNYIRTKYFNVKTIKELFNDIPTQKILDFLKEIGLFNIFMISIFNNLKSLILYLFKMNISILDIFNFSLNKIII